MTKLQLIDYIRRSDDFTPAQKQDMIDILRNGVVSGIGEQPNYSWCGYLNGIPADIAK